MLDEQNTASQSVCGVLPGTTINETERSDELECRNRMRMRDVLGVCVSHTISESDAMKCVDRQTCIIHIFICERTHFGTQYFD